MPDEKASVPLQQYVETRFDEMDKRLTERFQAQEKAVTLAVARSHWVIATAISVVALAVSLIALFWKR